MRKRRKQKYTAVFLLASLSSFCTRSCTAFIWYLARKISPLSFPNQKAVRPAARFPRVTACKGLCALLGGRAESLPHRGLSGQIWTEFLGGEGADEKKAGRKDRRRSAACPPTNARSAGISRVFLRRRSWNFQSAVPPFSPQIRPVP